MPQQLTGATANGQDGARLDISANGVWGGRYEKTYFDVRVFNPHAPSNKNMPLSACYKKHEREKKRAYVQRVHEVEHSSFTPLVLAATGGLENEATSFYKRLASLLSQKWEAPYSTTLCWLQCRLAFSLLCSSIQAIRGARSSRGHAARLPMLWTWSPQSQGFRATHEPNWLLYVTVIHCLFFLFLFVCICVRIMLRARKHMYTCKLDSR